MSQSSPEERLRIALNLAAVGEQIMRARLKREHPDYTQAQVNDEIVRWRQDRPGAPYGDYPGQPSNRVLGEPRP